LRKVKVKRAIQMSKIRITSQAVRQLAHGLEPKDLKLGLREILEAWQNKKNKRETHRMMTYPEKRLQLRSRLLLQKRKMAWVSECYLLSF